MSKIKRNNIIKIGTYKYIVYKLSNRNVELLPIDELLSGGLSPDVIPKIVIKKELINSFEIIDDLELLFLVNQKNPLIKQILNNYFESQE